MDHIICTAKIPATLHREFPNPAAMRAWLVANKLWPASAACEELRARFDHASQSLILETSALVSTVKDLEKLRVGEPIL